MPLKRLRMLNTTDCLWVYILRLLKDNPMHAYAIRDQIKKSFGFRSGTVTVYKVLYLLHKRGLVEKKSSGRQRIYTITKKGKEMLRDAVDFYKQRAKILG